MKRFGLCLLVLGVLLTLSAPVPFFFALNSTNPIPLLIFLLFGAAGVVGLGLTSAGLVLSDPLA